MSLSLQTVADFATQLTPILLSILLILLIAMVIRILFILIRVRKTVDKLNTALDFTNDYLEEFKIPVRAIVNVSMSIEALRAATEQTIQSFYDKMSENTKKLLDYLKQLWDSVSQIKKEEEEDTVVTKCVTDKKDDSIVKGEL